MRWKDGSLYQGWWLKGEQARFCQPRRASGMGIAPCLCNVRAL